MNGAVGFFLQPRFAFCKNGLKKAENNFYSVKIILLKSDNCALTLRKRLFCDAKPMLLPCKTAAFGMRNNRFCNALMVTWLSSSCACEKYLHLYSFLFVHRITYYSYTLLV